MTTTAATAATTTLPTTTTANWSCCCFFLFVDSCVWYQHSCANDSCFSKIGYIWGIRKIYKISKLLLFLLLLLLLLLMPLSPWLVSHSFLNFCCLFFFRINKRKYAWESCQTCHSGNLFQSESFLIGWSILFWELTIHMTKCTKGFTKSVEQVLYSLWFVFCCHNGSCGCFLLVLLVLVLLLLLLCVLPDMAQTLSTGDLSPLPTIHHIPPWVRLLIPSEIQRIFKFHFYAMARIEVMCFQSEGVDAIKMALKSGIMSNTEVAVTVRYLSAPCYTVKASSLIPAIAEKALENSLAQIEQKILQLQGNFRLVEKFTCDENFEKDCKLYYHWYQKHLFWTHNNCKFVQFTSNRKFRQKK